MGCAFRSPERLHNRVRELPRRCPNIDSMTRAARLLTVFAIVAGLFVLLIVAITLGQAPTPLAPLPTPNGYNDLVNAGRMLSDNFVDAEKLDRVPLHTLITNNAEVFRLAHTGLYRECRVPLVFSEMGTNSIERLGLLKGLARALTAQGRLAELENQPGDAAQCYADTIRLGCQLCRGGLIIDALVGVSIESIGVTPLERLLSKLSATQCRQAALAIESGTAQSDSSDQIISMDRTWAYRTYGFRARLSYLLSYNSTRKSDQRFSARWQSQQNRTHQLMLDLAARAYELDHGHAATNLAELVPAYLKALPQIPAAANPPSGHTP